MRLAITICATKNYTYCMGDQARMIIANFGRDFEPGHVILSGDDSRELLAILEIYQRLLPHGWQIHHVKNLLIDDHGHENYKQSAQLIIAQLRSEAFSVARKLDADACWSLDSDVLPPFNALRCMQTMLEFDAGYYSVASCPYPNSLFLGGRGTPQNPICDDFLPHERLLPEELKHQWDDHEARFKTAQGEEAQKLLLERKELMKKVRDCPPDGNLWQVIAKHGWRRRGWLDFAYPAIGKGAVLPSDWCGFGCTLMNREALNLATFEGYDGQGTEDLFIAWKRWFPHGLRTNVITHCPCDHVIWEKKKGGDSEKYIHHQTYHEQEGEYAGHLRVRQVPVTCKNGFMSPLPATETNDPTSSQPSSSSSETLP